MCEQGTRAEAKNTIKSSHLVETTQVPNTIPTKVRRQGMRPQRDASCQNQFFTGTAEQGIDCCQLFLFAIYLEFLASREVLKMHLDFLTKFFFHKRE